MRITGNVVLAEPTVINGSAYRFAVRLCVCVCDPIGSFTQEGRASPRRAASGVNEPHYVTFIARRAALVGRSRASAVQTV